MASGSNAARDRRTLRGGPAVGAWCACNMHPHQGEPCDDVLGHHVSERVTVALAPVVG